METVDNPELWYWRAVLDNHEPARNYTASYAVRCTSKANGEPVFAFWADEISKPHNAVYVLDDGKTAVPYYVTGWSRKSDKGLPIWLQTYPVNPSGVIDYNTWSLGPRKSYHLKINKAPNDATVPDDILAQLNVVKPT